MSPFAKENSVPETGRHNINNLSTMQSTYKYADTHKYARR
jgi:hypothetical protein